MLAHLLAGLAKRAGFESGVTRSFWEQDYDPFHFFDRCRGCFIDRRHDRLPAAAALTIAAGPAGRLCRDRLRSEFFFTSHMNIAG